MNYATMTDKELRLEVAKRKGWSIHYAEECNYDAGTIYYTSPSGDIFSTKFGYTPLENWPTDIASAWGLVEEMKVDVVGIAWDTDHWAVDLWISRWLRCTNAICSRAICEAWLAWKDAQEEP